MSDQQLPEPLVPAEVDLRDFQFLPLDVRRLRDSRFVATRTPAEALAGILLWSASWHQEPASSLPDDEIELCQLAGYGRAVREYRRVKTGSLYGFVLCSDERWYHPVVAEKAAEGWNGKLEAEHKRACDRARKLNKEREQQKLEALPLPARPHLLSVRYSAGIPCWRYFNSDGTQNASAGIPCDSLRKSRLKGEGEGEGQREGQGKGEGEGKEPPRSTPVATGLSPAAPPNRNGAKGALVWEAYSTAYFERWNTEPVRNARVNSLLAQLVDRVGATEAPHVAAFFVHSNKSVYVSRRHPVAMLVADAEGLRTEWATNRASTTTAALQGDRTAAIGDVFRELKQENRSGNQ